MNQSTQDLIETIRTTLERARTGGGQDLNNKIDIALPLLTELTRRYYALLVRDRNSPLMERIQD